MGDITGPQFWENIDPENLDEMQSFVLIEHLRAENNMLFDRAAQRLARIKELEAANATLTARIAYYEAPNPDHTGSCAHKFREDGICIRCNEDAEEWDAGCVEEVWAENDDLRAELAALTAQLQAAQEWLPVPAGEYTRHGGNIIGPITLYVGDDGRFLHCRYEWSPRDADQIELPFDWRLVRRRTQEEAT